MVDDIRACVLLRKGCPVTAPLDDPLVVDNQGSVGEDGEVLRRLRNKWGAGDVIDVAPVRGCHVVPLGVVGLSVWTSDAERDQPWSEGYAVATAFGAAYRLDLRSQAAPRFPE